MPVVADLDSYPPVEFADAGGYLTRLSMPVGVGYCLCDEEIRGRLDMLRPTGTRYVYVDRYRGGIGDAFDRRSEAVFGQCGRVDALGEFTQGFDRVLQLAVGSANQVPRLRDLVLRVRVELVSRVA